MNPKLSTFPPINKGLLEALEKRFPDRCPEEALTDQQVRVKMGNVAVIRFLRTEYNRQNKTILSP